MIAVEQPPKVMIRTSSILDRIPDPVRPAPIVLAALIGAAAVTSGLAAPATVPYLRPSTSTTGFVGQSAPAASASSITSDALVRRVREAAGLTWDQLARVFGVSRRSVHNWSSGEKMSAHNLELLGRLYTLVTSLGSNPDEVRVALFAPDSSGESPIDVFRQMAGRSGQNINGPFATQEALFDV